MGHRTTTLKNIFSLSFTVVVIAAVLLRPTAGAAAPAGPDDEVDRPDDYGEEMMGAPGDVHTLHTICFEAKDAQKCESTVHSISPGLNETSPANVVDLHIEAARRNTQAGLHAAAQLLNSTGAGDAAMKAALATCVSKYDSAGRIVKRIPDYQKDKDAFYIVGSMMSVLYRCRKCDDAIKAAAGAAPSPSPMAKYSSENDAVLKNLLKLYRVYWGVTDEMAFHNAKEEPLDMAEVNEVCGKYAVDAAECVSSVVEGAKLVQFKGPTSGLDVMTLSGKAMAKTREAAAGLIKGKPGSPALAACGEQYALAAGVIDSAFKEKVAYEDGWSVVIDATDALKLRLPRIARRFRKCQAALDTEQGRVDGALLALQKRLVTQARNIEAIVEVISTQAGTGMGI